MLPQPKHLISPVTLCCIRLHSVVFLLGVVPEVPFGLQAVRSKIVLNMKMSSVICISFFIAITIRGVLFK